MDNRCQKQVGSNYKLLKMKKLILFFGLSIFCLSGFPQETGTFTDPRDGKVYKTVKINGQIWMAENLAYKVKDNCWAYDNNESNVATYGYIYSWKAAKEACPKGWHLPSDVEWSLLTDYLGGESDAGGKLKESEMIHWKSPNEGASNETGFTALPGGYRHPNKTFFFLGYVGYWWTASESRTGRIYYKFINWESSKVNNHENSRTLGLSVRCIMD